MPASAFTVRSICGWVTRIQPQIDRTVNALAGMFDPEAIIFGGQLPPMLGLQLIAQTRFWHPRYDSPPERPRLVLSEAGSWATMVGAALQPLSATFFA